MRRKKAAYSAPTRKHVSVAFDPNHNPTLPMTEISLFFTTRLTVQHLGSNHEANSWGYKAWNERDRSPILVSSLHSSMATELGSMALLPAQPRRSSRHGRGLNGRDVQLDRLGDVLAAPTHQAKKQFAPSDELSLPNNLLAPVPKKRRRKKVLQFSHFSHSC